MHRVKKKQIMVKKKTGIKACIVVIFLFCIQVGTNTQADDGCFEGFSSIPGNLKYSLECDPSKPSEINPGESKTITNRCPRGLTSHYRERK